jgi:carboxyl-terminal processing protease
LTQLTDSLGPQDLRPRDPNEPIEKIPPDPARDRAQKREEEFRNRWKNATELPIVMQQLQGGAQGEHELTIERGHPTQTLHVNLALGTTKVEAFSSRDLNDSTGYVRILAFNPTTPKSVADALTDLQKRGKKQLVLDLRESAGGSLEAARDVASLLLGDARFAVLKVHDADRKLVDRAVAARKGTEAVIKLSKLSVLVDGGTAGTSELLAAALHDHLGAALVGTPTFGDGTEQELMTLDNGAGLTITRARMLTDKGQEYDGHGLKPDLPAPGDSLDAAVKALSSAKPIGGRTGA